MVKHFQEICGMDAKGPGMFWRACNWIRGLKFLADIGLPQDGIIRYGFLWQSCVLFSLKVFQKSSSSPGLASTTPCGPQLVRPR